MTAPIAGLAAAFAVFAAWDALVAVGARLRASGSRPAAGPLRQWLAGSIVPTNAERRRLTLLSAACALCAGWLTAGLPVGIGLAAGAPAAVTATLSAARERRRRAMRAAAGPVARALADALAAGRSTGVALAEAATGPSIGTVTGRALRRATRAAALGESAAGALARVAHDADDPTWDAIVAAIELHRRSGGDLALLLRRLALAHDDQLEAEADARSVTVQARHACRLIAGMPVAGIVLLELALPGTIGACLADPLSLALVAGSGLMFAVSLAAVARLSRTPR